MHTASSKHKVITLTGNDCIGKETQSKLLTEALKPSVRMTAPDYDHWAGQIVRSILHKKRFGIIDEEYNSYHYLPHLQDKHPQILQLLHNINAWDKQKTILSGLESHHWVMDRYIEDAYAYGLMDGCDIDYLLNLNHNFVQSDLVIVMLGKGFPRPGEVQDINEKDADFQDRVRNTYRSLSGLLPDWRVIEVDAINGRSGSHNIPIYSIHEIHCIICEMAADITGQDIAPLQPDKIAECRTEWLRQKLKKQYQEETA